MLHGYDIKITDDDLNDSDKEDQQVDWTEDAFRFVNDFIYGIEGSAYQRAAQKHDTKKLKEEEGIQYGGQILEFYLSQVYTQLVQKTNQLIVTQFIKIGNICDEKPIYMLILVSKVIKNVYPKLPREKLNVENEKSYRQSVLQVLSSMKNLIVTDLKDSFKQLKEAKKMKKDELDKMENKINK